MNFKQVKVFVEELDYSAMLDYIDAEWCHDDETYYWIGKDGVYSCESREGVKTIEDFLILNGDTQMGYWITYFFKLDKKISYEDFCDKYEDMM